MCRRAVCSVLVALCGVVLCSSPAPAGGEREQLAQWNPSESWAGQRQADARLDQPVQFWQAAVTLEEVFQRIAQQTGVKLGFYPENDENRRVRIHLFLNKEQPPTLREVMVQLAWVVDCPFFLAEEGGQKNYYLMATGIAASAEAGLQQRAAAAREAAEARWKALEAKLDEYRQALSLSREEAIAKYRGKDDLMLLNLLDPARRAAVRFACRHGQVFSAPHDVPEGMDGVQMGFGETAVAATFTDEDRADAKEAFHLSDEAGRDERFRVDVNVETAGRLTIQVGPEYTQTSGAQAPKGMRSTPYLLADVTDDFLLSARDRVDLDRALGVKIPADQVEALVKQREAEIEAERARREQARLASERSLSAHATEKLEGITLHLRGIDPESRITSWFAEEEVAKASGYNVVADGLFSSGVGRPPLPEFADKVTTLTALAALDSFTHRPAFGPMRRPVYEWGDAGTFLRFRTADRDVWRAAMLPEELLDWVDSLLKPYLPDEETLAKRKQVTVRVPIGLVHAARMLGGLSDLQVRYGMDVDHGDPRAPATEARYAALIHLLGYSQRNPGLLRLLASLDDTQWARLKGEGLLCDDDLSPDQQRLLSLPVDSWSAGLRFSVGRWGGLKRLVMSLTEEIPKTASERMAAALKTEYRIRFRTRGAPVRERGIFKGLGIEVLPKVLRVDVRAVEP